MFDAFREEPPGWAAMLLAHTATPSATPPDRSASLSRRFQVGRVMFIALHQWMQMWDEPFAHVISILSQVWRFSQCCLSNLSPRLHLRAIAWCTKTTHGVVRKRCNGRRPSSLDPVWMQPCRAEPREATRGNHHTRGHCVGRRRISMEECARSTDQCRLGTLIGSLALRCPKQEEDRNTT